VPAKAFAYADAMLAYENDVYGPEPEPEFGSLIVAERLDDEEGGSSTLSSVEIDDAAPEPMKAVLRDLVSDAARSGHYLRARVSPGEADKPAASQSTESTTGDTGIGEAAGDNAGAGQGSEGVATDGQPALAGASAGQATDAAASAAAADAGATVN